MHHNKNQSLRQVKSLKQKVCVCRGKPSIARHPEKKRGSADEGPTPRLLAESIVESDVESVVSDATAMADPGPVIDQLAAARESQNRVHRAAA